MSFMLQGMRKEEKFLGNINEIQFALLKSFSLEQSSNWTLLIEVQRGLFSTTTKQQGS
jgi:hypothetical protein